MSNGRDTLKPARGRLSQFVSEIKAKFKNPGFQKDLAVYGGIASIIPIGRVFKVGAGLLSGGALAQQTARGAGTVNFGKIGSNVGKYIKETRAKHERMSKAFGNTSTQYSSGLPKSMKAMFEAPKQYSSAFTPQATTTAKVVAKKNRELAQQSIRPLHRDGKVYDKQAINDAFSRYFNR
jgi:hypothetical protein